MSLYHIKKILAAVDFSETSLNALKVAASIAREHDAFLRILNVAEPSFGKDYNGNFATYSSKTRPDVFSALVESLEHTHDLHPKLTQVNGNVIESIITTAMAEECDLIVMGTHGASGVRENFIGSNTYGVFKYSLCPVLSIPPQRDTFLLKRILFPIRPTTGALMPFDVVGNFLSYDSKLELLGISHLRMQREMSVMNKIAREIKEYSSLKKLGVNVSWGNGISIADDILQHASKQIQILLCSILP